ncbi:helix-turn-helix domain-containing protein [Kordiimonas lipolytica]|uniref:Helix-turn-helix domain-containing protein n=1 Tax=Kordiimonas lipolytica TaxID=1662421 RepID=A0ABV8U7X8_9PROT|nr:helix-turn-helix transcriptional regulator [Kordiimonas lipolytica]
MKFGAYIKVARDRLNWTQPEAAKAIGVEQSYLSKLENGRNYPAEDVFDAILKVYAIDLSTLCSEVDDAELLRLKEIKQVRDRLAQHTRRKSKLAMHVAIAASAALAIGTGLITHELIAPETITYHYQHYRSYGVIRDGESLNLFDYAFRDQDQTVYNISEISARLDYDFIKTIERRGTMFVVPVEGGRRRYDFTHESTERLGNRNQMLVGIGAALAALGVAGLFAGLAIYSSKKASQ